MNSGTGRVVCIGGATLDRKYYASDPVQLRTSNPVKSKQSFGGVARNVAENIARLGVQSSLVSIVGQDENGCAIQAALKNLDIDTQHVAISSEHATAEYVAVLDTNGELALGLANMAIFDELTPSLLHQVWPKISDAWIFADCNLPAPTLQDLVQLARRNSSILAIDAVSALKVTRLPRDLRGIGLLFLNLDEAQAFLSESGIPPHKIAEALLSSGAERVVMTLGESGLIAMDPSGYTHVPSIPVGVVDATGAGDALIASTLVALMNGRALAEAVQIGTVAAALTLECPDSVHPDLSLALLEAALVRSNTQKAKRES